MTKFIFLILVVAPISTFIHELGHALGARINQAANVNIYIGKGKRWLVFSFYQINVTINRLFFVGGYTEGTRGKAYQQNELIAIAALGPIFNGFIALLLYILLPWFPHTYIEIFFWFNLWLCVINLIPIKIREKHTDGYTIFTHLFPR